MAKNNPMLAKLDAYYKAYYSNLYKRKQDTLLQMAEEAAIIAAHDVLGLGAGRAVQFTVALRDELNALSNLIVEDAKDDKQIWYTKDKHDEKIKAIVGEENFAPWEERYPDPYA